MCVEGNISGNGDLKQTSDFYIFGVQIILNIKVKNKRIKNDL